MVVVIDLYVVDSHTDAFVNPSDSILRIENADTSGTTGQAFYFIYFKNYQAAMLISAIVSQADDCEWKF